MTSLQPPYQPSTEQAALVWVKAQPQVPQGAVATSLPTDVNKWANTGFNSDKAPWGKTQALAEYVFHQFFDPAAFPLLGTIPNYFPVNVRTGYPLTEIRKVPGNPAGYAQVTFDAQIHWSAVQ
jgi:hypothetical protein